ncbi:transcriptional regulator [Gordonia sp. L191]|uniref:transcriptional regulator n=1 Tax=Gordonia TaxID=2053 RepID=UPI001AD615F3|nr:MULTISPECIES: transcriptional regulator [Gordonia]QTI71391.1 transcriptional regulator [Gordonia polyisoprenivorans]WHU45202.1 transcriptional regulator [Gordonia sp. L191]
MSAQPGRRRHRPALLVLVVVAAIVCLGLAWWQWDTYEAGGTGQNLGYALQWPAFGFAFLWAYRRFVVLESDPEELQRATAAKGMTEIPEDLLPDRASTPSASSLRESTVADDDAGLREYNRYLAELSAADRAHGDGHLATATPDSSVSEDRRK